jgi:hypothetical protein
MTHPKPYEATAHLRAALIDAEGPRRMTYKEFAEAFGYHGLTKCTQSQFNRTSYKGAAVPMSLLQAEMDYWTQRIPQIHKAVEDAHHAS